MTQGILRTLPYPYLMASSETLSHGRVYLALQVISVHNTCRTNFYVNVDEIGLIFVSTYDTRQSLPPGR